MLGTAECGIRAAAVADDRARLRRLSASTTRASGRSSPLARHSALRPALFLDRDGVIVEEVGHLRRAEDVRLIAGAAEVIAAANRAGMPVVVVSNQSGIGRGSVRLAGFRGRSAADCLEMLAARGAFIDAVLACPYHAEAEPPYRHPDHPARKPNAGMILAAARYAADRS